MCRWLPAQAETRCGWYHHPTPGWHYLQDADGEWWFSTSAAPPALGFVTVPGFEEAYDQAFDDRVRLDYRGKVTDYSYGFSCAATRCFPWPGCGKSPWRAATKTRTFPSSSFTARTNSPSCATAAALA